ncbi:hypothetical protein KEM48_008543 [Puccinia striiformis f. sp. tritici PST-130]|nr:hypothetical protein KEM48_008543 [Puccinia striiformis f. sp. tritici PST-130]
MTMIDRLENKHKGALARLESLEIDARLLYSNHPYSLDFSTSILHDSNSLKTFKIINESYPDGIRWRSSDDLYKSVIFNDTQTLTEPDLIPLSSTGLSDPSSTDKVAVNLPLGNNNHKEYATSSYKDMINKLAIVILLYLLGSTFGRPLLSLLPSASLNQTASLNVQHSLSSPPGTNTTSTLNDRLNHDDDCLKRRVSPQLWMDLKMNEYIESYPHGEILSLKQYANRVGANNFNLEIGSVCRVDQLCNGVSGKDWYALVAAQRWSTRLNQAFDAVAFASTIAMGAVLSVFYATTAIIRPLLNLKYPVASHAFTQWSDVGLLLTDVKKNVQGALMNMTMEVNTAGISTATGLRGLNHDGQLFSETIDGAENKMQQEFDQAYKLQTLSHLWKLQDPCNGNGENGSWSDRGYLSYCTPDGITEPDIDPLLLSNACLRSPVCDLTRAGKCAMTERVRYELVERSEKIPI